VDGGVCVQVVEGSVCRGLKAVVETEAGEEEVDWSEGVGLEGKESGKAGGARAGGV
jgi:hypothetical protein